MPKLVKELAQLAGCKKVNDAYFQMKSAWCCGITVSLWYMSLGAIMIGMCGCCSVRPPMPHSFVLTVLPQGASNLNHAGCLVSTAVLPGY